MNSPTPLISRGNLTREALKGQVAVVTGAGRGIGFEASRALIWLGARVVVAEIDRHNGTEAAARLNAEFGSGSALFVETDVGDEKSIEQLAHSALRAFGRVDIVVNNATITPMGAVKDVSIKDWDASYRVNLRGPAMLARAFLPGMLERNCGVFVCVSSVGSAFMGAYESFKAAQVHLANTMDAELEGTGVIAFTIGPGMVPTPGLEAGLKQLGPMFGKTVAELYAMNESHIISVEAAGAGFAAAVALAPRFRGQEIDSTVALAAAGITIGDGAATKAGAALTREKLREALAHCKSVCATLAEQAEGWKKRSLFERQWVIRDFRKNAGMPVEEWLEKLERLEDCLEAGDAEQAGKLEVPLDKLAHYYSHMKEVAAGYLQSQPEKLKEQLPILQGWLDDVEALRAIVER